MDLGLISSVGQAPEETASSKRSNKIGLYSLTVDAVIAPTASLNLGTAAHLDGSGTIEMVYP